MKTPTREDLDNFASNIADAMHHPEDHVETETLAELLLLVTHAGLNEGLFAIGDYFEGSDNKGSLLRTTAS